MIDRYGSEEAVREFMKTSANKSKRNLGKSGGFGNIEIARKAGLKSAEVRWGYNVHKDKTSAKAEDGQK